VKNCKNAVQKVVRRSQNPIAQQLEILMQKINKPSAPISRIALPTIGRITMIPVDTIISCEADSNYTTLRLKNHKKMVVSRNLKDIEELLEEYSFARVHRCYLVNLNEVEKFVKGEGGYLS
jgi:two-component system LytT family response regulator